MAKVSVERLTGNPNFHEYVATSVTPAWSKGDLVKLDTNGTLIIATSTCNLGIAQADAPSDVTTKCLIDVLSPDESEFAIASNTTTAVTLKGQAGTITYDKGAHYVTAGSAADCSIIDLDGRDTIGKSGGRVIVRFRAAALQGHEGI